MIELLPPSELLLRAVLDGGWLEDQDTNRLMGHGSDAEGLEKATAAFLESSENGMFGIYSDAEAVGWVTVDQDDEGAAQVSVFVAPEHRKQGIGSESIKLVVKGLLDEGYRRIYAEVPEINQAARTFFRRCGFKREGKRWLAQIIDGEAFDVESLVVTNRQEKK